MKHLTRNYKTQIWLIISMIYSAVQSADIYYKIFTLCNGSWSHNDDVCFNNRWRATVTASQSIGLRISRHAAEPSSFILCVSSFSQHTSQDANKFCSAFAYPEFHTNTHDTLCSTNTFTRQYCARFEIHAVCSIVHCRKHTGYNCNYHTLDV